MNETEETKDPGPFRPEVLRQIDEELRRRRPALEEALRRLKESDKISDEIWNRRITI
jgi:hypothetical protein